jgi:Anthranilate/para-aminobenzoate synthases component I
MLLDLGRNDVGRVAEIGSVEVTEQFIIEYYSHVMHIVSNVEGTIRPGLDAIDALAAGFPAGTTSGAPKVRAMEIIDELERERRGVYAGAVGYFAASGAMDTCIALRTAVVKDGTMYVQAGGGIVADSTPEAEFQESCQKARALVRAAQEAVRFAADRGAIASRALAASAVTRVGPGSRPAAASPVFPRSKPNPSHGPRRRRRRAGRYGSCAAGSRPPGRSGRSRSGRTPAACSRGCPSRSYRRGGGRG